MKHTLEEEGAVETNALGGMGFLYGRTIGGGVDSVVFSLDGLSRWHLFACKTITLQRGMGGDEKQGGDLSLNII